MRTPNALGALTLVAALVCGLAGCGGDPPSPKPIETPKSTAPPPSTPSPDLSKYSEKEKQAWEEAYAAFIEFFKMDDQFLAVGKATTEARDFYQEHALIWAVYWDNLQTIDANNITVKGGSRDIWVKPTRIKFGPDGSASVTVTRCVDNSHLVVVQDGKTVPQDGDVRGVSSVELSRFKDAPWKITVADKEVGKC